MAIKGLIFIVFLCFKGDSVIVLSQGVPLCFCFKGSFSVCILVSERDSIVYRFSVAAVVVFWGEGGWSLERVFQ